jgi:CheY-like chemotaxis protein
LRRGRYEKAEEYPLPNLILLDIKLPGMSGIDVLEVIKSNPETSGIPVVMLTSSALEEDISRSYKMHANSYVLKPTGEESYFDKLATLKAYWKDINHDPARP